LTADMTTAVSELLLRKCLSFYSR